MPSSPHTLDAAGTRSLHIVTDLEAEQRRITRMPLGLHYQGRHPDVQPQPAECSTDIGGDDGWTPMVGWEAFRFWVVILGVPALVIGGGLIVTFWG